MGLTVKINAKHLKQMVTDSCQSKSHETLDCKIATISVTWLGSMSIHESDYPIMIQETIICPLPAGVERLIPYSFVAGTNISYNVKI